MTLTLDQFRATKRPGNATDRHIADLEINPAECLVYLDGLWLHDRGAEASPRYYLILIQEEFESDDLADLEAKLYEFAFGEGALEA